MCLCFIIKSLKIFLDDNYYVYGYLGFTKWHHKYNKKEKMNLSMTTKLYLGDFLKNLLWTNFKTLWLQESFVEIISAYVFGEKLFKTLHEIYYVLVINGIYI